MYRSPSGPAAQDWAVSRAGTFRSIDVLSFPPTGLWSERQYIRELTNTRSDVLGVWDEQESLVAFACTEHVLDESHMLSLAVHPEWRGRGIAKTLVLASLWAARAAGQRMLTLEVRASNAAAIGLYRSCGLGTIGTRPRYYRQPPEDALLLARGFDDAAPPGEAACVYLDDSGPPPRLEMLLQQCDAAETVMRAASADDEDDDTTLYRAEERGLYLGELPLDAI